MAKENRRVFCAVWRLNLRALLGAVLLIAGMAGALTLRALAAGEQGIELPVVMYHALLKDEARHGQYVISPAEFEGDLLWLKEHGYTTISTQDLIAYTQGAQLPEKPVLLTFDDGYYNNYLYAYPIAKQYRCKFLISPIAKVTEDYSKTGETNAYYTNATWEQLREMTASGLVEVGCHSYDLHHTGAASGVQKRRGETPEAYRERLTADISQAQAAFERELGQTTQVFVYPFGAVSDGTGQIIRDLGFTVTFTCREKHSRVTRDPESLFNLGRFLRPSGVSSGEFFRKMGMG